LPATERKSTGLATLLPELGNRPSALTSSGLFLVRMGRGCVAVFTSEEFKAALRRGKAVLRSRLIQRRLQSVRISDTAQR
jgi:hypothetical protein